MVVLRSYNADREFFGCAEFEPGTYGIVSTHLGPASAKHSDFDVGRFAGQHTLGTPNSCVIVARTFDVEHSATFRKKPPNLFALISPTSRWLVVTQNIGVENRDEFT